MIERSEPILSCSTPEESLVDELLDRIPSEVITSKEIAQILRVSRKTIYQYFEAGIFPALRLPTNRALRPYHLTRTYKRLIRPYLVKALRQGENEAL